MQHAVGAFESETLASQTLLLPPRESFATILNEFIGSMDKRNPI